MPRGLLISLIVGAVAVVGLVFYLMTARSPRLVTSKAEMRNAAQFAQENALEQARESLTRNRDMSTCRSCVQQINTYLTENNRHRPPRLTASLPMPPLTMIFAPSLTISLPVTLP